MTTNANDDDMETLLFGYELSERSNKNTAVSKYKEPSIANIYSEHLEKKEREKEEKREKKRKKKKKRKNKRRRKRKKKKYNKHCTEIFHSEYFPPEQLQEPNCDDIPDEILLDINYDSGFFFGVRSKYSLREYIGIPQGADGNILVIGGNGSGKSSSIAKPTLITWKGTMCVTDIKGELSDFYAKLYQQGIVTRPFIIFDPMQTNGISYDPFYWLSHDDEENLISNIQEITFALIPISPNDNQAFWVETEQSILAAALLYYFKLGAGFSETLSHIVKSTVTKLIKEILESDNVVAKMFLGEVGEMKPETLATFDRGLRNSLIPFATNPHISNAFRGVSEKATCFSWNELDNYNIFLRIPEDKIEQWGGAFNLMYTQLIRYLERRPDKYSPEGQNNVQTLLLMDEFARFGKLEMITNAMATLRSKNVNICLMIQSTAQLDKIYGEYDRRIIFDNCQYQAILRANDAETQKYISELIGVCKDTQLGLSENLDEFMENIGYGRQINEIYRYAVFPHELSTLKDILLLTPYGFYHVEKNPLHNIAKSPIGVLPNETQIVSDEIVVPGIAIPISEEDVSDENLEYPEVIYCESKSVHVIKNEDY